MPTPTPEISFRPLWACLLAGLVLLLAACGSSGGSGPGNGPEIAGTLEVPTAPAAMRDAEPLTATPKGIELPLVEHGELRTLDGRPRLVPGEIIVRFRDDRLTVAARDTATLLVGGATLLRADAAAGGATLYRVAPEEAGTGAQASETRTLELAAELDARPEVAFAVPNRLAYPLLLPDDTNYPLQWHYPAIRMPEAWDVIRESDVTVAVVDTGIYFAEGRPDLSHADLFGKVLPGMDFISDARSSGDQDGLDPLPFDMDLSAQGGHGTHVAGTIAAATNNGRDVAGIDWGASILPVRVLGFQGGTTLDIMQGTLWAAGGSVPGVAPNPNPAQVINMSLGGRAPCDPYVQSIFQQVFDLGAIVVVAAGNENDDANRYFPASCPGVITVGATDARNDRAPYSNYGPRIDVMAPGGDMQADADNNGVPDGVLSLGFDPNRGEYTVKLSQGTSMAAPHVAGVISLMKGIRPSLTAQEALTILRNTAVPLSTASCKRPTNRDCGAGLIDARAAIQAVGSAGAPAAPGQTFAFAPSPVDFGPDASQVVLTLTNPTNAPVGYSVSSVNWLETNPAPFVADLLSGDPTSGTVPANGSVAMTMFLDRSKIPTDGQYAFEYVFEVNGAQELLLGRFGQGAAASLPTGPTLVASVLRNEDGSLQGENGEFVIGGAQFYGSFVPEYAFDAVPGDHLVIAWVDENRSDEVDEGDFVGVYEEGVLVTEQVGRGDVDVDVSQTYNQEAFGAAAPGLETDLARALEQARLRLQR